MKSPQDVLDHFGFYVVACNREPPAIGEVISDVVSKVLPEDARLVVIAEATLEEFTSQAHFMMNRSPYQYGESYWKTVAE